MTPSTTAVVVPSLGVTVVILLTTAMAAAHLWNPTALLVILSVVVIALGFWHRRGSSPAESPSTAEAATR